MVFFIGGHLGSSDRCLRQGRIDGDDPYVHYLSNKALAAVVGQPFLLKFVTL